MVVWWVLGLALLLSAEAGASYLPSYGDLKRDRDGLLWIYMGPDGTNFTEMWGTMNDNAAADPTHVEDTLCHQLGYDKGHLYTLHHNINAEQLLRPVWLSGIICDKEYDHILRCDHDPINSTNYHGYDIHLDCYDPYDHVEYKGQVSLVPPAVVKNNNASHSHGIVTLAISSGRDSWGYIQLSTLDQKAVDTVCRQLGYTNAVLHSIMTREKSQWLYGYQYDLPVTVAMNSSHLSCLESSQCIGCCMNNWATIQRPDSSQSLTMRCTFSNSKPVSSGGNEAVCEVSEGGKIEISNVCPYNHHPSYGDLKRDPDGLLWIYMGPDGTNFPEMWGTINGATDPTHVEDTLCHQLGYDNGHLYTLHRNINAEQSQRPVWLSGIICGKEYDHILRCDHNPINSTNDHGYDIHLDCYDPYDHVEYKGQVSLVPPAVVKNNNASHSHGIVTLATSSGRDSWGYIQLSTLEQKAADTVCRQLGYTNAVLHSIMTREKSQWLYGYQYDLPAHVAMNSSHLSCLESSQCIGCCVNNWATIQRPELPDSNQALTMRCSFSNSKPVSSGNKMICEVSEGEKSNVCAYKKTSNKNKLAIWLPVGSVLVIILSIIAACCCCWWYRKLRRRGGYDNLDRAGGNGNGGNGHGGNGDGGNGRGGNGHGGNGRVGGNGREGNGHGGNGGD